jgi:4-amino-4-deoxy-L-arabinose transferase-like glycosyltransferase
MIDRLIQSRFIYLVISVFYAVGLWGMSVPLTGDQKVYLSIALEMKERSEWMIPYLFNEANFLKPPLQYWATLLSWNVFGLSIFGAMIPSVLALLGSAWLVNRIANRGSQVKTFLPGLIFSASLGTMTYGTTAQMEIWIVFFYLWAWLELLENRFFRAFAVVGVMAWVKGPLYPVLWVISSWMYFYYQKEPKKVLSRNYLAALAVGVVIGLGWFLLAARTHLQPMLDVFLLRENVAKMQTSHGTPMSLWGEFLYSLFPWVFWLILAFASKEARARMSERKFFYLSFALFPALFFTFFPYRVNTYLYLLTPIAAMIACDAATVKKSGLSQGVAGLVSLIAVGFSIFTFRLMLGGWIGPELGWPLLLILGLWAFFYWTRNLKSIALVSLVLVNLIRVGAVELGERDLAGLRAFHEIDASPLAYWIDQKDIWHEFGLVSAALKTDIQRLDQPAARDAFLNQGGALILQEYQIADSQGLKCQEWFRLRRRLKFPIVQLLGKGLNFGDPSLMRTYLICKKP